jgi:hypothetical protein
MNTSSHAFGLVSKNSAFPAISDLEFIDEIVEGGNTGGKDLIEQVEEALEDLAGGEQESPQEEPKADPAPTSDLIQPELFPAKKETSKVALLLTKIKNFFKI